MRAVRVDLHVHTRHSRDARGTVLELACAAIEAGLQGFAVTDHDTVAGHRTIGEAARETGVLIVPGIEVTTAEGHLLAYGVDEVLPRGLGLQETVQAVEAAGGVAVPSHPLRMLTGIGPTSLRDHAQRGVLHACEAINSRERRLVQENTQRLCATLDLAQTGGSDAHLVRDVGTAWTRFDEPLDSVADLLEALQHGRCRPEGDALPRHRVWAHRVRMPKIRGEDHA